MPFFLPPSHLHLRLLLLGILLAVQAIISSEAHIHHRRNKQTLQFNFDTLPKPPQPLPTPQKHFIILSSPRSGSTLTEMLLQVPSLHLYCSDELMRVRLPLQSHHNASNVFKLALQGSADLMGANQRNASLNKIQLHFLQHELIHELPKIWGALVNGTSALGFKVFYEHLRNFGNHPFPFDHMVASDTKFFTGFKIVHLVRRDFLARAISLMEAFVIGSTGYPWAWQQIKGSVDERQHQNYVYNTSVTIPPAGLNNTFYQHCDTTELYKEVLVRLNDQQDLISIKTFISEDIISPSTRLDTMKSIYAFILDKTKEEIEEQLSPKDINEVIMNPHTLSGRGSVPLRQRISNWDDVRQALLASLGDNKRKVNPSCRQQLRDLLSSPKYA